MDDLDWENERLWVYCPKPGRTHAYPLSREVGDAILCYIREVRPSGFGRALFFTMRAPIRPLDRRALGQILRVRVAGLEHRRREAGTPCPAAFGGPASSRPGHVDEGDRRLSRAPRPSSTAIYAKANLAALREVAALDLEGLA